jgi:3-hydroxybutyryl-CoA dehydrogenase
MKLENISRVAIVGAGTMGAGMSLCFAHAGYDVILQDIFEDQIEKALDRIEKSHKVFIEELVFSEESAKAATEKISVTESLEEALDGVQFVLEAIPEDLKLKQELFTRMEGFCATDTILATNSSGLSIASIASACTCPNGLPECIG